MKRRSGRVFLLLGVLLVVVVGAVFLWMSTSDNGDLFGGLTEPIPSPTPLPVDIVVARRDIEPNTVITNTERYFRLKPFSPNEYDPTKHITDMDMTYNKMVSATMPILSGTKIMRRHLTTPPLSFQVPRGRKAVSVRVDYVSGVGQLLSRGDRVDLILLYEMTLIPEPKPGQGDVGELDPCSECPPKTASTVKTVVYDAEVLKVVDLPIRQGIPPAENEVVVVLAMSEQDAEITKFAVADEGASIHLIARRYDERGVESTTGITARILINRYGLPVPCPLSISGDYPEVNCSQ